MRERIIRKDDGSSVVEATGRDGRTLWLGHTKFERYPENEYRFYSFRYALGRTFVARMNKLSYLLSVCAENGLTAKSVKPLTRLAIHWKSMKKRDFKGLCHAVICTIERRVECRRPTGIGRPILRFKPFLTGKETKSKKTSETVPLWDWRER